MAKEKIKKPGIIRPLLGSVREYKQPSVITPIFMALEAFCECLIPFFMARMIAAKLGMGVGISSGANFIGAVMLALRYGPDANIITVFPDDNKKYLSTDYANEQKLEESSLVNKIELNGAFAHSAFTE